MTEFDNGNSSRTCKICFRLREDDRTLLETLAGASGMGVSAYVRVLVETTLSTMRSFGVEVVDNEQNFETSIKHNI